MQASSFKQLPVERESGSLRDDIGLNQASPKGVLLQTSD